MKADVPELIFNTRSDFRDWLSENAGTSEGVWLVFGKTGNLRTLSANDALEEALCFGWIDGVMKKIDSDKYRKYFARRRAKSVWSEKNKAIVQKLRESNIMTELGEQAVQTAMNNGMWDAKQREEIAGEQVDALAKRLAGISPAYENFTAMPPSVRKTYTRRYLSFKSDESREKDFLKIVERLNQNLKPM